jgi:hypothetical protein
LDNSYDTYWLSKGGKNEEITIDFKKLREFGGLEISWLKGFTPTSFNILLSENGKDWEKSYSVKNNKSNKSFIHLPEAECQFVKIQVAGKVGISDIKFLDINSSTTKTISSHTFQKNQRRATILVTFPKKHRTGQLPV